MCNFGSNREEEPQVTATPTQLKFFAEVSPVAASPAKTYTPAQKSAASFWHGEPSPLVLPESTIADAPQEDFGIGKMACK